MYHIYIIQLIRFVSQLVGTPRMTGLWPKMKQHKLKIYLISREKELFQAVRKRKKHETVRVFEQLKNCFYETRELCYTWRRCTDGLGVRFLSTCKNPICAKMVSISPACKNLSFSSRLEILGVGGKKHLSLLIYSQQK